MLGTCRDIKVTVSLALCDPGRAGTILERVSNGGGFTVD